MLNILHVVNIHIALPYFIGGQFRYFANKGHKLHVICSSSPCLAQYSQKENFSYEEVPILRRLSVVQDLKSLWKICRYIKRQKTDIVVGHTPKGALLAMLASFLMRVPVRVYVRHGLVYETSKGIMRFILLNIERLASFCSTKTINVSPSVLKRSIRDRLGPVAKQSILGRGTCSGIDTSEKFNPALIDKQKKTLLRRKLGLTADNWVVGFCGRLVCDKGVIDLVNAFLLLKKEITDIKLLLVGVFEERDAIPKHIQELIIRDPDIIYTGYIYEDQEYYYSLMDVLALPSYREGFPTCVLEASAMMKPVVTTRVTGCIDSIIENETGLFIDNDHLDLQAKLKYLYRNDVCKTMGENGRKYVVANFDNKIVWKEIEKSYIRGEDITSNSKSA